jgi:ferredoxin-NADP reductase
MTGVAEEILVLPRPNGPASIDLIICQCMKVRQSTLASAMKAGCRTVQELSASTGAGTACGSCLPQLAELTAETLWQTVHCVEVIDRALRVRSFRFEIPAEHAGCQIQPGQRLIVRGTIGGLDVQRPYTLTSPTTERRYYEITVQREPHGLMSNWLFDNVRAGSTVAILPPSGDCFFELAETRPLVCLVGGIGITPALSICRSAAAGGGTRRVHVDYSVSTREQIVCAEELSKLTSEHATITCRIRVTREEGRLCSLSLAKLSAEVPDCDWLICGSNEFRADMERRLHENGIAPKRIHVESFRPFSDTTPASSPSQPLKRPQQHKLTNYSVLAGVAVFVAQALAGVKWPLLDQLQSKTAYSALTGTILLLLIVMQWRLSYVRLRHGAPSSARAYHLHIASGPAVLGMIWLHSTGLGYGLSMSVCLGFLGSLATGAVLSARPRSPSSSFTWERVRRILLASHVAFSCAGSGLVLLHGFSALWY